MGSNSSLPKLSITNNIDLLQIYTEHSMNINCLTIYEKDFILATGSDDGIICIWKLNSFNICQLECIYKLNEHNGYITELIFHNDYLISSSSDGTIRKWNFNIGKCEYVRFDIVSGGVVLVVVVVVVV
ncbi:unnamed protein product, partial [Schistosoma spindalis]